MSKGRERSGKGKKEQEKTVLVATLHDGRVVRVDPQTLSLKERKKMKQEVAKLGYEPDEIDILAATIWVVAARDDEELTFDELLDLLTVEDLDKMDADVAKAAGGDVEDPEG